MLTYTGKELIVLKTDLRHETAFEKETIELNIRRMEIKKISSAKSLKVLVDILYTYKVDTISLKEVLIINVGADGSDLFEFTLFNRVLDNWGDKFSYWFVNSGADFSINLFLFLLILVIANVLSNMTKNMEDKATRRTKLKMGELLRQFFILTSGRIVFFIGFMMALNQLGIELAPLLIGFALQGTISNFASGVMILLYHPFDVGDFIIAGGEKGSVEKLSLVNTTVHTIDNRKVVIPNNLIWEGVSTNLSAEHLRRVDLIFGIGYGDYLLLAEKILNEEVAKHPKELAEPEAIVKVPELGDSSVNFWGRPWVENEDYWHLHWDLTKAVKLRFDEKGISIPFPQRDVHLYTHDSTIPRFHDSSSTNYRRKRNR